MWLFSAPSLPTHPITFSALRPGGSLLESAPLSPLSTGFPLALVFGRQQLTAGAERGIWVDPCLSCSTLGCLPLAAAGSLYDSGSLQADPSPWLPLSLGFCWAISTPSTLGGDGNDNAHPCWALGATASSVCLLIPSTALDSFPWKHLSWILCPARMLACTATVVSFTVGHDNLVQCTRLSFVSVLYPRSIRPMWTHHEYGDVSLFTIQWYRVNISQKEVLTRFLFIWQAREMMLKANRNWLVGLPARFWDGDSCLCEIHSVMSDSLQSRGL